MSKQALRYKERGNAEFKKGNHGKAIEYYTYATELDPNNHIFFTNRATAYYKMKKFDKSLRDAKKAIRLNNGWWKGHMKKTESLFKLQQWQECLEAAKLGASMFPERRQFGTYEKQARAEMMSGMSAAEIAKNEGNEFFKTGRTDKAIESYTEAIGLATPSEKKLLCSLYANRAACNRQLYMHDEVISDCTKALKIDSRYTKAYIRRGQSFEAKEKYEEALADFQAARDLGGGTVAMEGVRRCTKAVKQLKTM